VARRGGGERVGGAREGLAGGQDEMGGGLCRRGREGRGWEREDGVGGGARGAGGGCRGR